MGSRQNFNLKNDLNAPSFPKCGRSNANVRPGFKSFNCSRMMKLSPTSTTYHDYFNKNFSKTFYKPAISNSQRSSCCCVSSYSNYKWVKSIIQTNEIAVVNAFESFALTSTRGRKSVPYDELYRKQLLDRISIPSKPGFQYQNSNRHNHPKSELLNFAQKNSSTFLETSTLVPSNTSTAESKKSRRRKQKRWSTKNVELILLKGNSCNIKVNLVTMKSIGIGPLCPPNKNSLFPLVTKIHHLCNYLSGLVNERCQMESKILRQKFNSKSRFSVPRRSSISHQIAFIRKFIFIENSMCGNFIKNYGNYLDKEVVRNTIILFNALGRYTDKLSAFETLKIYQKYGELTQDDGDRIKELEILLSEIITYVRHFCTMFFIMKHDDLLKKSQKARVGIRQCRNIFIG